jgi:hypothetical protein
LAWSKQVFGKTKLSEECVTAFNLLGFIRLMASGSKLRASAATIYFSLQKLLTWPTAGFAKHQRPVVRLKVREPKKPSQAKAFGEVPASPITFDLVDARPGVFCCDTLTAHLVRFIQQLIPFAFADARQLVGGEKAFLIIHQQSKPHVICGAGNERSVLCFDGEFERLSK